MYRNEAKRLIAIICIISLVSRWFLWLVSYAPLLQDTEFEEALVWAHDIWIPDVTQLQEKPFAYITRAEAAAWYVAFAQSSDMLLYNDDICTFNDIDLLVWEQLDMVILSCMYRFFRWSQGWYSPDAYLTKAWSLVALMKWFFPTRDFEEMEPYWEPFVQEAYAMWITSRQSDPYMMYLVSRYELLLQLHRARQRKQGS